MQFFVILSCYVALLSWTTIAADRSQPSPSADTVPSNHRQQTNSRRLEYFDVSAARRNATKTTTTTTTTAATITETPAEQNKTWVELLANYSVCCECELFCTVLVYAFCVFRILRIRATRAKKCESVYIAIAARQWLRFRVRHAVCRLRVWNNCFNNGMHSGRLARCRLS